MARSEAPRAIGSSCAKKTWRAIWSGVTVKSAAKIQSRIATLAGIVTTASITIATCSAGANSRLPPASSARRSATGAPGEMAISTMPTATGPFTANALSASTATTGTGTTTAKTTAASTARRSSAAAICSRPSIKPMANMTANTVNVAKRPIH